MGRSQFQKAPKPPATMFCGNDQYQDRPAPAIKCLPPGKKGDTLCKNLRCAANNKNYARISFEMTDKLASARPKKKLTAGERRARAQQSAPPPSGCLPGMGLPGAGAACPPGKGLPGGGGGGNAACPLASSPACPPPGTGRPSGGGSDANAVCPPASSPACPPSTGFHTPMLEFLGLATPPPSQSQPSQNAEQQYVDNSTMTSPNDLRGPVGYQKLLTMPFLGLLLVGALFGLLLLPCVKNKWLSYLSSYCGCVSMDKMPSCHNTRPRIMPPGMQHENMVDWVHCPLDHHQKVLLHHHA